MYRTPITVNNQQFGKFEIQITNIYLLDYFDYIGIEESHRAPAIAFEVKTKKGKCDFVEWIDWDDFNEVYEVARRDSSDLGLHSYENLANLFESDNYEELEELIDIVHGVIQEWLENNSIELAKEREIALSEEKQGTEN